ncbi:hypothetical protein BASA81_012875 [Batrachochytrium salamandrivorans]|nr:hypothetical protein BASA81_012875 [Batrachochytrium salamandrivorans]
MKLTIWIVSIAFTLNVIEATVIPDEHYANTEQERLYTRSVDAHHLMEGDASGLSLGNSDIQSSLTKRWFGRRGPAQQHSPQKSGGSKSFLSGILKTMASAVISAGVSRAVGVRIIPSESSSKKKEEKEKEKGGKKEEEVGDEEEEEDGVKGKERGGEGKEKEKEKTKRPMAKKRKR